MKETSYKALETRGALRLALAVGLTLLIPALEAGAQDCSAGGFLPETRFPAGTGPTAVVAADFNGDGRSDLAVADGASNAIRVLLGDGTGNFGAPAAHSVGVSPQAIVAADLNGDGRVDLAVANAGAGTVSILLGNGAGGFGAATAFAVGSGPRSLAAADLNGDGRTDLVTANQASNDVSVLLGTGTGSFGTAAQIGLGSVPFGAKSPASVAVGDLNADGRPDIVTGNTNPYDFAVSVLLGTGTGTFGNPTAYGAAGGPDTAVAIQDLNADGKADLVVAHNDPFTVWSSLVVYVGNGTGTFGIGTSYDVGATYVYELRVQDLNGDGRLDVAAAASAQGSSAGTLAVLLGTASGFGTATHLGTGLGTRSLALASLDGDGRPDLVAANTGSADVSAIRGTSLAACGLSVRGAVVDEGDGGLVTATFSVTLFPASNQTVTVRYTTVDGTATAGTDYLASTGTLTFPPGTTTRKITVSVIGDMVAEAEETFSVTLHTATNAAIVLGTALGAIRTDELSSLLVNDVTLAEGDAGATTSAFFAVTLQKPSELTVTVDYTTVDGTALAGTDYTPKSGTLSFPAGVTSLPVAVPILGNALAQPHRTFTVKLSNPTNYGIARDVGTGTIVDDDGIPTGYTIADLGTLPGKGASYALGLNDAGRVVGRSNQGSGSPLDRAFSWQPGALSDLGTLAGGTTSTASAINDAGMIVGSSDGSGGFEHAVAWVGGVLKDLGTFKGQNLSRAHAVNDEGLVVGEAQTSTGLRATLWEPGVETTDLGALPGGFTSTASDINNRRQVVGWSATSSGGSPTRAFLWEPGSMTDLGTLGGSDSFANALNDSGVVVGKAHLAGNSSFRAFRWESSTMSDLGALAGAPGSVAWDVNGAGDVVGASGAAAVVWPAGGAIVDLNTLLPAGSGWTLTEATAVNDRGQVAGHGAIGGQTHAFLLSPPPVLLSVSDANVSEDLRSNRTATFTLSLSPASSRPVTVAYATADISAAGVSDYLPASGVLTFAPGVTSQTVNVTVRGDTVVEGDEHFVLNLGSPTLATILDGQGIGAIRDAGAPVTIGSFTISPYAANGPSTATLTWTTTGASTVAIAGVSGALPPSGSASVGFFSTTTYTLTATGPSGATATAQATVSVLPAGGPGLAVPSITAPGPSQVIGVSAVTVTWGAVAGAAGYGIRVLDTSTGATLFSGSLSGGGSTAAVLSLASGTYSVLVRACGSGGDTDSTCGRFGSVGFSVSLAPPKEAPKVVTPAPGSSLTSSTTTLSWSKVDGANSYEVVLKNLTSNSTALQITVFAPDTSTIFSLGSGLHELTVRACGQACGPPSAASVFSVTLPQIPATAPVITSATVSGTDLSVAWTPVANADLYQVQVVQPGAGPGGGALSVAARQVSATGVALPVPSGASQILVSACNGDGCGPYSAPFAVSPAAGNPPVPNLGTPMKGTVVSGPVVNFSWNRVPSDTGANTVYRLYVADLSRQTAALDVYTTDNFWAAYFKAEGARYDAQVIANPGCTAPGPSCSAAEASGPSAGFNVAGTSAVAPTLNTPAHQSQVKQGNLMLGWTPVAGASLYQYYISGGGQNPAVTGVTTGLLAQVPLAAVGGQPTSYVGIVRACPAGAACAAGSDAGWGPWSVNAGPGVTTFTVLP